MAQHHELFSVREMCRVLHVSPSGYYAWCVRPESRHTQQDEHLSEQILQVFEEHQGRYGSPRVHQEVQAQSTRCSEKRVARLMREQQLVASKPRRFVATTDSEHAFCVADNLLDRQYQVQAIADLNRAWAGDITYIPTAQGWLYVAVVLDLKSRMVIGWSMAPSVEQTLVSDALEMALNRRAVGGAVDGQGATGLLFHCSTATGEVSMQRMIIRNGCEKLA